jgi:peptidoglycan/LPS O-acetylase OafA/YrhL
MSKESAVPQASLPVTGNTEKTRPENRAFYPALDGLRAIAFLLVFSQHYLTFRWGWSGVNVFFVLSGFLITGILFDSRNDEHRVRNFYVRRALRIFPLYYGVILVIVLFRPLFHWQWSSYWLAWPLYLANHLSLISPTFSIDGSPLQLAAFGWLKPAIMPQLTLFFGHFWSLCVEEQFYFLWPWIVFRTSSRRGLIWICAVLVVLDPLLRIFAQHHAAAWGLRGDMLNWATPFQLDSLLLGAMIALLLRGPHRDRAFFFGRLIGICIAIAVAVFFVARIVRFYPDWQSALALSPWGLTWGVTIINLFAASVILCVVRPAGLLYRVLCLDPLRWVGRISYGAYVFFDIFHSFYWWMAIALGSVWSFVARHIIPFHAAFGLVGTLLMAWLSFEYFESKFINLKEKWTILPEQKPVAEVQV